MMDQWFEGSAPGRLDVMGGIADYSGSLVLQMPIHESTNVKLKLRTDFLCSIVSTVEGKKIETSLDYRKLLNEGKPDLNYAQQFFKNNKSISWSAYVMGCVLVLHREKQIEFKGADFVIESDVPLGKGVSSSASIEVAVMKSLEKAFALQFSGTELPRLAQKAENLVVGAACGLMDQLVSYFGEPKKFLPIICQPDILKKPIAIPKEIHFMGIDSGVRHSVGDASYSNVRCAAFMGYSIIAKHLGAPAADLKKAKLLNDRTLLPFNGYLSNVTVKQYESDFKSLLPETMMGRQFIETFSHTIDQVTEVDPHISYAVRACTAHPIYENDRVNSFMNILNEWASADLKVRERNFKTLGALMHQSHESYSACGLGSERTDEIVEEFKKFPSVAGAKITGGGSGGTVCALASGDDGINDVLRVHSHFSKKYRAALKLFK